MAQKVSVLDIASPEFDVDAYLSSQLKEKSLDELVKEEEEMVASVRRLDSDVHQLVYENYNKFLTATSTVRKIQDEFNLLDSEMESLSTNMKNISGLIGELSGVLGGGREGVAQLGSSYKVVKSLQSIFELPGILQASFDEGRYSDVVRLYLLAQKGLNKYADMKNMAEIQQKADQILAETEKQLIKLIDRSTEDVEGVAEAIGLLMKLGKSPKEIQALLLKSSEASLQNDLKQLQSNPVDVLDLVDKGCESFIPNLTLLANLHERLFPDSSESLLKMLQVGLNSLFRFNAQLRDFHEIVSNLFLASSDPKDCSIVVRALDRYFRKMSTCRQVVQGLDCSTCTISLIREVSKHEVVISRKYILEEMKIVMQEVRIRQSLMSKDVDLPSLAAKARAVLRFPSEGTALANLLLFIASDVTFSTLPPADFQAEFAHNVHEEIVIGAFKDMTSVAETYGSSEGEARYANPLMMLLLAFTLHHLANKSSQYLLSLCREQFSLTTSKTTVGLTGGNVLCLLCLQSAVVFSDMLFVELLRRFWNVTLCSLDFLAEKPVEKKVVIVDRCRLHQHLIHPEILCGVKGLISTSSYMLFNRASIIGAIVKVLLKSFIESIRLQTYGKFAVEQIQVDCYYLQRGVSPLVADEVVVNSMVDQALSSALKRCVAPELIHPSRLRQICDEKPE
ncbi:Vps51/Vps67 [Ancylostoma duodenale]|uniref:Vacuolar protein sorting-associated protein 51 homolog n=1 Tax=Ancylostoma duodenale TaxID=51022 RepID=A0A0C2DD40_9BILA|nr:Vps51/Vps67 [Ancylostoma duodenale]